MPNLSSFWWVEIPGVPFSTMNAVIPLDPFSGSVFAYTTKVDAMGPFVILVILRQYFATPMAAVSTLVVRAPIVEILVNPTTHQNLFPFNLYPPFTLSALVRMLTTSLPLPVSLIARLPTCFPEIKSGKYFAFCASVPCRWI